MEICFTALDSLRRRDMKLMGHTSILMFPIYASAVFLKPLFRLLKGKPIILRGLSYASLILVGEYIAGTLLSKSKNCPWDYTHSKWHIKKIVRLDYLPNWILAGLFFEYIMTNKEEN